MKPLISVIIPVYNNEKYLKDCLNSVLAQTYMKLQVIVVDDGSTDKSGMILDQYTLEDSRVEVFHNQNQGVSAARNFGLKRAVGEFITFVDSDDLLEPNMYENLMNQFFKNDVDIVHCGYKKIKLDGTSILVQGTNKIYEFNRTEGMLHFIKGDMFTGALWNKMYKSYILKNIYFDESIKINEDVLFNFYAFQRAKKTIFVDKTFYHYYERENASTKRTPNLKRTSDCRAVAEAIYNASIGEDYEVVARLKYIMSLMNQYRAMLYDSIKQTKSERKKLKRLINELLKQDTNIGKKYIINYRMMDKFPKIYIFLYNFYDKIRKPNWDV